MSEQDTATEEKTIVEKPGIKRDTDLVIPLGTGSTWGDNNELRYALRSMEKNFPRLRDVYILTHKDYARRRLTWLKGAHVIHAADPYRNNKDANIIRKVLLACKINNLSRQFVRMSDDQILLKKVTELPAYHTGDIRKKPQQYWQGRSRWKARLRRTANLLARIGRSTYNYDTHIPTTYDKVLFQRVARIYPYNTGAGCTINTMYFNFVLKKHEPLEKRKATFEKPIDNPKQIAGMLAGKIYMGYNAKGLTDELKGMIERKFPKKSRFEK